MSLPLDPTSLSPLVAFNQDQIALDQYWCQTLVGLDEHNAFVPILVTRVPSRRNGDISADGLRITYHLRRDVRFADGVAFTAADVAFTYRAILDPANGAPTIHDYERLRSLTTPDAHTVVVHLSQPWSAAVHVLFAQADEAYGILPAHAFTNTNVSGSQWNARPFGTGPFRVVVWHRGDTIELEPNAFFSPAPKLHHLVVRIVPDATAAFNALQTHAVDIAELSTDTLSAASGIGGLHLMRTPVNGLRALYFQTATKPTSEVAVRRAIAAAVDWRALRKIWRDALPAAHSVFPPPVVSWTAHTPPAYAHDVSRAARELDAAGWQLHGRLRTKDGQPLTVILAIAATPPEIARLAVIVQQELTPLGIEVVIKSFSPTTFSAADGPLRGGHFGLSAARFIGGSDPEQSLNLACDQARDGGNNYTRYCSSKFEALFAAQMNATSDADRDRDLDAIAQLVHDDVPLIPIVTYLYIEGVADRVTGYRLNMLYYPVHPEEWDAR